MAPYHALGNHGVPKQRSSTCTKTASEMLSVSKNSHDVAKPAAGAGTAMQAAPTIRVIHIFAPKVIKTDMANFRSTVQKLTGRSTKKRAHTARTKTQSEPGGGAVHPTPSPAAAGTGYPGQLWDQECSQKEVLQRLVGDACETHPLVRYNSAESTYSLDSGTLSSDSNETSDLPSPTGADSLSFYMPQRESAYLLSEIPAPFFGADMHACYNATPAFPSHGLGLQLPTPVMDSMLSFDVDNSGSGLGSPLPLSDPGSDIIPFPNFLGSGTSSGGGLYDILSVQQHCRLSVQQPFQGGNFFEMI